MSPLPRNSPWGAVQHCEKLIAGVFLVSTASHGGVMVRPNAASFLSRDALRYGAFRENSFYCFEEDCCEPIVLRELLDKNLWQLPDRISDRAGYEDSINRSLQQWQPEYWDARQKRLPMAERLRDGADKAAGYNAENDMASIDKPAANFGSR